MDPDGYIPVTLIASFQRIQSFTNNFSLIVSAIRGSDKIELSEDLKVRTKYNPTRWPLPDKDLPMMHPHAPFPVGYSDYYTENLNPDVPEFIPESVNGHKETSDETGMFFLKLTFQLLPLKMQWRFG